MELMEVEDESTPPRPFNMTASYRSDLSLNGMSCQDLTQL